MSLESEILDDPLARGYAAMTDEQVADSLNNTIDRTRNIPSLSGDQVFQATVGAEFAALLIDKQQMWLSFCGRSSIDPFGSANVAFVTFVFGAGSATIANLASLRTEQVSRATELGLGRVLPGHVGMVRA